MIDDPTFTEKLIIVLQLVVVTIKATSGNFWVCVWLFLIGARLSDIAENTKRKERTL